MELLGTSYVENKPAYLLADKIVAGSACVLSVFGALLVIFSFTYDTETRFNFKELYYKVCCGYTVQERGTDESWVTKYKLKSYNLILINLSVADIIVALSHIWGLALNLEDRFEQNSTTNSSTNESIPNGYDPSCVTQGAFTVLSTLASFFWTDILAVFLAFNIVFKTCTNNKLLNLKDDIISADGHSKVVVLSPDRALNCCESPLFLYIIFPFIGWGVPMIMLLVFAVMNMLGYVQDYDEGWCYFYLNPKTMSAWKRGLVTDLGYETWLWGSVVIVLVSTITYSIFACIRTAKSANFKADCTHIRYLSVGIAFTLLRIPGTTMNVYLMLNKSNYQTIPAAIINIIAGATLSIQGGVNGIIYLCCRTSMKKRCCSCRHDSYRRLGEGRLQADA